MALNGNLHDKKFAWILTIVGIIVMLSSIVYAIYVKETISSSTPSFFYTLGLAAFFFGATSVLASKTMINQNIANYEIKRQINDFNEKFQQIDAMDEKIN